MVSDLFFVCLFSFISLLICLVLFVISFYLGSIQYLGPVLDNVLAFECGFIAFNDSSANFNISFYLLGILFLIFDLEIVHLLPWIVTVWYSPGLSFVWVFWFIVLLTVGFIYEWVIGALSLAFIGS